jgi:hypothetical protein
VVVVSAVADLRTCRITLSSLVRHHQKEGVIYCSVQSPSQNKDHHTMLLASSAQLQTRPVSVPEESPRTKAAAILLQVIACCD